ncbi:MAG: hypothetical protein AB7I41_00530 [Candidatus Sericytochromatia bacterium]
MPVNIAKQTTATRTELWASLGLASFVFLFGLFLPINILRQAHLERDLQLNGKSIQATVVAETTCPSKPKPVACHQISYRVQDKAYTGHLVRPDLKTGQHIQVVYAPSQPAFHQPADYQGPAWNEGLQGRLLLTLVLGLVFCGTAVLVFKETWKKTKITA